MPTAAQRQRAAALAQLNNPHKAQNSSRMHGNELSVDSKHQSTSNANVKGNTNILPPSSSSSSNKKKIEMEWDDDTFSDGDSEDEEAAAFEMDGQDIWTQNYCSICDTLIEPGQGFSGKKDQAQREQDQAHQALHSPTSSISRNSNNGLKSKSGTIKARPPSADGSASNVKRTHSAGRIHAVGGSTAFGPTKRTGSAGSRLNALSELKPTTKLHADNGKGKQVEPSGSNNHKSPPMSRRSSNVSVRSGNSGSGPSSPISPHSVLPRTKKVGILGTLTPAALKQQEDLELAKSKAPPALYCSERCRQIDEQRSAGMGELVYYLQQPTSPTIPWQSSISRSQGAWSSRTSLSNMANLTLSAADYRINTPESECNCPECMEKSSTGGTVPSGASDTTESSNSYQYGPRGYKQRTTSGRIITPQNLYPPGGYGGDYFGNTVATQSGKRRNQAHSARDSFARLHTHRDSMSQAGTESSARSSDSGSDLWEPRTHSGRVQKQSESRPRSRSTAASVVVSDAGRGSTTTGTVTPDGQQGNADRLNQPSMLSSSSGGVRRNSSYLVFGDSLSTSQASTTSPLRLLRQGDHRALASVDLVSDFAVSPQPRANSVTSRSLASERTEGGNSSGFTVAAQPSTSLSATSILESRLQNRSLMTDADGVKPYPAAELHKGNLERFTDSPAPLDLAGTSSRAVGTLKDAQARAQQHEQRTHSSLSQRRTGSTNVQHRLSFSSYANAGLDTNGGSGSWIRSSLSAAWNSLRGIPNAETDEKSVRGEGRFGTSFKNEDGGMITPSANTSDGRRTEEPTPTQSLIKRPTIKRGDVPAFAHEIGRGEIPGECLKEEGKSDKLNDIVKDNEIQAMLSRSAASAHGSFDSEQLRRRSEKDRAHRHQRSKDISVLPPLLGVARTGSSANLHGGVRPVRTHSSTSSWNEGPDSPLLMPVRSNTPALRRGSSHSASLVGLQEYGTSPHRLGSVGSLGTSPRRAGLGWGALTPLGPPASTSVAGELRGNGHTANNVRHHGHHPHPHHHHHHHHHHHQHAHHNSATQLHQLPHHNSRQTLQHGLHRPHGTAILGTIGVLGAHPHGNALIKGRHSTTPVRMSTPRVPEHGGEMSGAQLTGEEGTDDGIGRVQPRSLNRRSFLVAPPSRPQSGMSMRTGMQGGPVYVDQNGVPFTPLRPPSRAQTPANATEDGQESAPAKLYPVLDLPNRQPTHDRYDVGWNLGDEGITGYLPKKLRQSERKGNEQAPSPNSQQVEADTDTSTDPSRKKLFFFDTS